MKKILLSTALLCTLGSYSFAAETPSTNASTLPKPTESSVSTPPVPVINCAYKIPKATTSIDQALITTWAKNAAIQSFDFKPELLEKQLQTLKNCYTEQGFVGFNDAMQKSGNIATIKSQQLSVSSHVDAAITITPMKENQWRASVPLTVLYQSPKEKLSQQLTVDLLIGRKTSGDLGIMQMIATPRHGEKLPAPSIVNAIQ